MFFPFELHIPEYQFCGPGTHLEKRLARDGQGINPLDAACCEHDIAYSRSNDTWLTIYSPRKRGNVLPREIQLSERESCSNCLGGYESQDENRHGFEEEEESKAILPITAKRGGINPIVVGDSRFIGRRSGGSRENSE